MKSTIQGVGGRVLKIQKLKHCPLFKAGSHLRLAIVLLIAAGVAIWLVNPGWLSMLVTIILAFVAWLVWVHGFGGICLDEVVRDEFINIANTESRAPIYSLKTSLGVCNEYLRQGRMAEAKEQIDQVAQDLNIFDDRLSSVLKLAAINAGRYERKASEINLSLLVDELNHRYRLLQKTRSITWSCYIAEESGEWIVTDESLLKAVIENAIDNAIKFTNIGFIKVRITLDSDTKLVVSIQDSGIGISRNKLKLIRQKNRLDSKLVNKPKGWGIGLYVMKRLTEYLNADLCIESKKGFGTKVTISVPVTNPTSEMTNISVFRPIFGNETVYVHNVVADGLNVLIVDNNHEYLEKLSEVFSPGVLQREDIQVTFCSSGSDALRQVEEFKFDFVLVDQALSELPGTALMDYIGESEGSLSKNAYRVIMTSDHSLSYSAKKELLKSSHKVVTKGFSPNDVRSMLRAISIKSVS